MLYYTGIAVNHEDRNDFIVAATTWHTAIPPNFSTQQITLHYARANMSAVIIVRNCDLITTINAACHRTVEQLLIRTNFNTTKPPNILLIMQPKFAVQTYALPHTKKKYHWLLNAADNALFDWLRGIR